MTRVSDVFEVLGHFTCGVDTPHDLQAKSTKDLGRLQGQWAAKGEVGITETDNTTEHFCIFGTESNESNTSNRGEDLFGGDELAWVVEERPPAKYSSALTAHHAQVSALNPRGSRRSLHFPASILIYVILNLHCTLAFSAADTRIHFCTPL